MKTPEEMAEEYATEATRQYIEPYDTWSAEEYAHVYYAFLAGYQAAKPQWISVKEQMPPPNICVLIAQDKTIWVSGYCDTLKMWGWYENGETCNPTHWMPLPEPPKGEE